MWKALTNLARFAGDTNGAFPPLQETATTATVPVHPDPAITAWGNFSELRRVIDSGVAYANLSIADKSTLHSAACTLGMLAFNIDARIDADPTYVNPGSQSVKKSRDGTPTTYGTSVPYYRSLYYIFPSTAHAEDRTNTLGYPTIASINSAGLANTSYYQAISDSELNTIAGQVAPRTLANWTLPKTSGTTCPNNASTVNCSNFNLINVGGTRSTPGTPTTAPTVTGGTFYRIPLKDTVVFNGREQMAVRVLNFDLGLLRQNKPTGSSDTWLPSSGLVFAFREDAAREDSIARPQLSNWSTYLSAWNTAFANPSSLTNIMNTNVVSTDPRLGAIGQDPPVYKPTANSSDRGISPKPIDYFPDPARKPYGFRLIQGEILKRVGISDGDNIYGITFVSDNPTYVQGNFNFHSTNGAANDIEEFNSPFLLADYSNFYTRGDVASKINNAFARSTSDTWRPAELLADGITLLSSNFCDGSLEDLIRQDGDLTNDTANITPGSGILTDSAVRDNHYGCNTSVDNTSYINQNLIHANGLNWPSTTVANLTWQREAALGGSGAGDDPRAIYRPGQPCC